MLSKNRFTSVTKKKTFSGVFLSVLFVLTLLLILFNKTDYYIIGKSNIKKCDIHDFIFTDLDGKMELCSFCKNNMKTKG